MILHFSVGKGSTLPRAISRSGSIGSWRRIWLCAWSPDPSSDSFIVYGRGVLHLSVLIETMRREGYELQVGQPKVIIKEIDGQKCEPIEELTVDIPEEYSGRVIELVTKRKGSMIDMQTIYDRQRIVFEIPSRGIIGLRSNLLTATAGEAVMSHRLKDFEPYKGDMEVRQNGSLIAMETGTAYAYAINKLQDRVHFLSRRRMRSTADRLWAKARGRTISSLI